MRKTGKILHDEARELLVESCEKTHTAEEFAKIFGVNKYTVCHMTERRRKVGSVALRTSRRGNAFGNTFAADGIACNFETCYRLLGF